MTGNIGLGLGWVLLGGLLQGSFALPMKRMPAWRWENTWFIYSIAGMLVLPWATALATVPHFGQVISATPNAAVAKVALFGFGWGIGSTLFGLGIRRVGMALTFAIVLGITASLGSLLPLVVLHPEQLYTRQGYALLGGLAMVILGIGTCSAAGQRRERELSAQTVKVPGAGFRLGLIICVLSGVFSAMLNFSFVFGKELQQNSLAAGATSAMASNLVWAVALSAGFVVNAGYCTYLFEKNRTWQVLSLKNTSTVYWLGAALMGVVWFFGIMAYGMGATDFGSLGAALGWPVFMAMNIVTANVWGVLSGEWKGSSRLTYVYSWTGISVLILAIYAISRASGL